jgi:hypothetical protein
MPREATTTASDRRRQRIVTCIVLLVVVSVVALLVASFAYPQWSSWRRIKRKQSDLVFHTDHAVLLTGCRQVWENRSAFGKTDSGHIPIDPSNPKLPPAILALDAHAIDVFSTGLDIELGGQSCHYGFETFFNDERGDKRTIWKNDYPSKELVSGLWFYAENGLPQAR